MEKYIPLDAVLAKIEKRKHRNLLNEGAFEEDIDILSFLNTLDVKEVDLDFMLHEYWDISPKITIDCLESATMTKDEMIKFAKHFFELGMAVSNKTQKGE